MSGDLLQTKLYVPRKRPFLVPRPHLIKKLSQGLHRKLTLISAPAGFGKTTLVSEWIASEERPFAWLSLDERDSDLTRFLQYLIATLQTGNSVIGTKALAMLTSGQPPTESILTSLLNEITAVPQEFALVLDDYHVVDAPSIDQALIFLLDHLPPQMHLVITTREDPTLPLSRLRARGQLTELRASDLRFTIEETAVFLQTVMGISLSSNQIAALETRTEGWVAGLQMAALSMQDRDDVAEFIANFTGSNRFIMDYLLEEVLNQQPVEIQKFLLQTAVLTRLCADLCDAVRQSSPTSQQILEQIETHNIFLTPLDNERHWYRYHHLFADLLRQRLYQSAPSLTSPPSEGKEGGLVAELHHRASVWYEENGLELDAFHHAAAANDFERTERLIAGEGVPLYFRGAGMAILKWLEALPTTVLNARPSLWVTYASALLTAGQHTAVEEKLKAAEAALPDNESEDNAQDLIGRIASMRATLAIIQHDVETIITQSRLALTLLHPDNLFNRMAATWTLGFAYQLQGDRAAANQSYTEVMSISHSMPVSTYTLAAGISLGQIQEADTHLPLATKTYRHVLHLAGDPPQRIACEAFLGLARICYQWNDLDAAQQYGQQCLQLTQQQESIDTFAAYGVFLARLKLSQGDSAGATALLTEAEAYIQQNNFMFRMPDVAAAQVLILLRRGALVAAANLAEKHELPISQARVYLAQGNASATLALLAPLRQQMETKGWQDERLQIMILQAIALQAHGDLGQAVQLLGEALALAAPGGFIRIFVDEGLPMARLLSKTAVRGIMPGYCNKLLTVFEVEGQKITHEPAPPSPAQSLTDPLTNRELEILTLIAAGQKNKEIAEQLVISLNTVLYHTKNIYSKLGVTKRTLAINKAKELNLI